MIQSFRLFAINLENGAIKCYEKNKQEIMPNMIFIIEMANHPEINSVFIKCKRFKNKNQFDP